jgi:hypothetical protein
MQTIREIVEFRSNKFVSIFAGLVTGAISAFNLAFFFIIIGEGRQWFLGFIGFLFLLISAAAFTYSNVLRIDKQGNLVEKITKALFLEKRKARRVSNFRGVGIATAGGGGGRAKYLVQLLGSKNMTVPGFENTYEYALMKARDVAECLNLPVYEKAKIAFFGHRI